MQDPFSQNQLKRVIAACSANLLRTDKLQDVIKIGVGYHNKWYRSQKEHWLGWIVVKEREAIEKQRPIDSITARERWKGLNCIPMMFWLAEAIGVDNKYLSSAEVIALVQAEAVSHDCPQHGKAMREALPWDMLEDALRKMPQASDDLTKEVCDEAFEHLCLHKPRRRRSGNQ